MRGLICSVESVGRVDQWNGLSRSTIYGSWEGNAAVSVRVV